MGNILEAGNETTKEQVLELLNAQIRDIREKLEVVDISHATLILSLLLNLIILLIPLFSLRALHYELTPTGKINIVSNKMNYSIMLKNTTKIILQTSSGAILSDLNSKLQMFFAIWVTALNIILMFVDFILLRVIFGKRPTSQYERELEDINNRAYYVIIRYYVVMIVIMTIILNYSISQFKINIMLLAFSVIYALMGIYFLIVIDPEPIPSKFRLGRWVKLVEKVKRHERAFAIGFLIILLILTGISWWKFIPTDLDSILLIALLLLLTILIMAIIYPHITARIIENELRTAYLKLINLKTEIIHGKISAEDAKSKIMEAIKFTQFQKSTLLELIPRYEFIPNPEYEAWLKQQEQKPQTSIETRKINDDSSLRKEKQK
ncbi:hypothetical protein E3E35_07695 [Thermococcus sp. GR7]|uniref:hypothetical protein n=1 Tax=unclassified Thermococcus TaxID=2627626 RepID=UPI0014313D9A|nr:MULTISPECIES: hypothetical protein [unclassified Thermococcus]NJE47282.1 hypothetical protein [Thermococcus sp. GR7]NJE78647.1 hypothetical protein [Thermococcus sp. GR4]NJF23228.1 hypothetical protein [Thermococcus sp. GR5]